MSSILIMLFILFLIIGMMYQFRTSQEPDIINQIIKKYIGGKK